MRLSGYMNAPTECKFIDLRHGMEYIIHHPNENIMYSRKQNFKLNESPHQWFLKLGGVEI